MNRPLIILMPLLLSGCSGLGTFFHDTISLPGDQPTAPIGQSETLSKVLGKPVVETPILAEGGDIWPGAPDPLPTLKDVAQSSHSIAESLSDPNSYFGRMSGDQTKRNALFDEGAQVSIGEQDAVRHGVRQHGSSASQNIDIAGKYLQKSAGTVVIQNGDGTVTLIAPDGAISVKKATKK